MDILHARTDPTLLERLKTMFTYSQRADITVGYLFISGFNAVGQELEGMEKVRVLVGRTDRATLDEVASTVQQVEVVEALVQGDPLVQPNARPA